MSPAAPDRRTQLLDAAETLFTRKGYLETGIAEIIATVGIARGTFYHHFASKEEVMEAIIERHVAALVATSTEIAARTDLSATDRLLLCLAGADRPSNHHALTSEIERPGNELMHLVSLNAAIRALTPVVAEIVAAGVTTGEFRVADAPATAAAFLTVSAHLVDDDVLGWRATGDLERFTGLVAVAEQLLGAAPGSLSRLRDQIPKR